jgi:recombination protein RecT
MTVALAEHREDAVKAFRGTLTTLGDQLKMALPSHVSVDKFHRTTMTALQQSPMLLNCDRRSLLSAILKAAQDGLLLDGREAGLSLYNDRASNWPWARRLGTSIPGSLVDHAGHFLLSDCRGI